MVAKPSVPLPVLPALALVAAGVAGAALSGCGSDGGGSIGFSSTFFFDATGFCGCSDGDVGDFPNTGADLGDLPDGATLELLAAIQTPGDEDWYEIEVDLIGNEFVEITLNPPDNEDYDLEIFDAGLNPLPMPPPQRGDQTERVAVANYIGDIFVRVSGFQGQSDEDEPYLLRFEHFP